MSYIHVLKLDASSFVVFAFVFEGRGGGLKIICIKSFLYYVNVSLTVVVMPLKKKKKNGYPRGQYSWFKNSVDVARSY